MGVGIKLSPGNGPYCFWIHGQIYHLVSLIYQNKTNKPGYQQICIFDSAEATTKQSENQTNQECTAEVMQGMDNML
jgi:hypothetical protein